ncbi:hypothetical protein BJV78DRAFT_1125885 [Lactifluus subvellereus]|nr:hypothetical protein BJV78DRAFT_1125885 [Lactifluus subvellereus]
MTTLDRPPTNTDSHNFDLEELVHVEQTFYTVGYEEGYAHGRLHGLIEGRALGAEKGFELWEELGFYEGAARLWTAVSSTEANGTDGRGTHHASALLALIERFPRKNPRPDEEGVDMSAQLRLIRSRYKTMCASLGVRARLQPAPIANRTEEDGPAGVQDPDAEAGREKKRRQKRMVWALDGPSSASTTQGLSF